MPSCIGFSSVSLRRNLSLAGLVAASLALARFAPAADTSAIDPCRLVTKQEAQAALGAAVASEVSPPARANKDAVRICSIQGTNGRALTVFVGSKTKEGFDREKKGMTVVTGIGDDAYANPPGIVAVRKGEKVVTLSMNSGGLPDDKASLERVKTLARAAAGRL